ncbi:hypothetical protein HK104_002310, partial [Borealophlyctis nickersoniae]
MSAQQKRGRIRLHMDRMLQPLKKTEYASETRITTVLRSGMVPAKIKTILHCYLRQRVKGIKDHFEVPYNYKQKDQYGLLDNHFIEIDVVNCQPTVLMDLFKVFNIQSPPDLQRLIDNRAAVLQENRITDKKIINKYLNRKSNRNIPHPFLANIHSGIYERLFPRLRDSTQFRPLWDWIQTCQKQYNREGSFIAYVPDSLIFDGMFVKKDDGIGDAVLRECKTFFKKQIGIDVVLAIKSMECTVDYDLDPTIDNSGVVIDSDAELSGLIAEASGGTNGRLAHLAMHLMRDRYICKNRKEWYKFVRHRWRQMAGSPVMDTMEVLVGALGRWYDVLTSTLDECSRNMENEEQRRAIERSRIMKDVEDLMDEHTTETVFDDRPFLLCFENGVYDLETDTLRPGCPDDYLKLGVLG